MRWKARVAGAIVGCAAVLAACGGSAAKSSTSANTDASNSTSSSLGSGSAPPRSGGASKEAETVSSWAAGETATGGPCPIADEAKFQAALKESVAFGDGKRLSITLNDIGPTGVECSLSSNGTAVRIVVEVLDTAADASQEAEGLNSDAAAGYSRSSVDANIPYVVASYGTATIRISSEGSGATYTLEAGVADALIRLVEERLAGG